MNKSDGSKKKSTCSLFHFEIGISDKMNSAGSEGLGCLILIDLSADAAVNVGTIGK
jgi:hypothetical protein